MDILFLNCKMIILSLKTSKSNLLEIYYFADYKIIEGTVIVEIHMFLKG